MSMVVEPLCEKCGTDAAGGQQEELADGRIRCGSCGNVFRPFGAPVRELSPPNAGRRQTLLKEIDSALRRADEDGRREDAQVLFAASQQIAYLGREYDAERSRS